MGAQFVIYGQSRSGSTLLVDLMNCSSSIHCDGELFGDAYLGERDFPRLYNSFPIPFIYRMRGRSQRPVYGFKLLLYQIRYARYWIPFLSMTGWRIIHVRRGNIVNQAFSSLIAGQRRLFHRRGDDPNPTDQIVIEPAQLDSELSKREQWTAQELDLIGNAPRLTLTYEEDLLVESAWPRDDQQSFVLSGRAALFGRIGRPTNVRRTPPLDDRDQLSRAARPLGQRKVCPPFECVAEPRLMLDT